MLDLFSHRIVGWKTSHRIDRLFVCDAFNYAMARQGYPTDVMVHSHQGLSTVVVILGRYY